MPSSDLAFSLVWAQLVANFCETLFYGIYLVTFCYCIPTLFMKGTKAEERWLQPYEIHWVMVGIACTLFVVCAFDVFIGFAHNMGVLSTANDPIKAFLTVPSWINTARTINQIVVLAVGDFLLIYRCWIVFSRRRWVIVPSSLLYIGSISVACRLIAYKASIQTNEDRPNINHWWSALFAITAMQNILSAGLLIWRIWSVERQIEKNLGEYGSRHPRRLTKVIRVIAESGAIYTAIIIACAFLVALKTNLAYLTMAVAVQSEGIAFNVIIARCSARREQQFASYDRTERSIRFAHAEDTIL